MNMLNRLALAAIAVALSPHAARAEGPPLASVQVYCQPGSINNCFAFALTSMDGHVTYYLQNLQGSLQAGGPAFAIDRILVENRALSEPGPAFVRYLEGPGGTSAAGMTAEGNVLRGGNVYIQDSNALPFLQRLYMTVGGVGLLGCQSPYASEADRRTFVTAQTCLPIGLDGWLRFDADASIRNFVEGTGRPATIEDFYFNVQGCDVFVGSMSGVTPRGSNCSTNIDYASLRNSFTTVPEPSSIALVASGLVGTGLLSHRRRKS